MNEFDNNAREWDNNPSHWERSEAVAKSILKHIPVKPDMKVLEYGAGTGILSFLLANYFSDITMMDNSPEMVKVMQEKVTAEKIKKMVPVLFNLEEAEYTIHKFDFVYTQMVLHHVTNPKILLKRFYKILSDNGFLAIADLYSEDGSFHGEDFHGHHGFDPEELQNTMENIGFKHITTEPCYIRKKPVNGIIKEYPIFLMVTTKK